MAEALDRPRGCTCFRLRRVARRVTRLYDAHLAPVGLTLTQFTLLTTLIKLAPPNMNELAEMVGMDRTTLTRTLKPLIAANLVAFEPGADRRSKCVVATAAGRMTRENAKPLWRAAQTEIESRLGPRQVNELHSLLDSSFETLADA